MGEYTVPAEVVAVLGTALALCILLAGILKTQLSREKKNNKNHSGNPGPQPCMEGGQLLGEFRLFAERFSRDTAALGTKLDQLIQIAIRLEDRIPRG